VGIRATVNVKELIVQSEGKESRNSYICCNSLNVVVGFRCSKVVSDRNIFFFFLTTTKLFLRIEKNGDSGLWDFDVSFRSSSDRVLIEFR